MQLRLKDELHINNDEAVQGWTTGFGLTVPSDGDAGWIIGAMFTDTTTGSVYVNEGTLTACDFNAFAVLTSEQNTLVGATPGTAVASKALIVDSNIDIAGIRNLGATGAATFGSVVIGGGYGSTGATISAAGIGQFNGALTSDGLITATGGIVIGGGYGLTGATISAAGVGQFDGAVTIDGELTVGSIATIVCTAGATFGGGYGSTGATISTAGVGTFNGALTTDGLLTSAGVTTSAIVQINDNVALNFEGVAADVDGLQITCDAAGDALVNVTAGKLTLTTSDGDIATLSRIAMGAQGAAVPLTTASPFGLEVQTAVAASVVYGDTGWSAGVYSRYEVTAAQTNGCTHIGVGGKMRVKADVTDGGLAGVYGYLEISEAGTVISGATSTSSAGQFAIEADASFELTDGFLDGVTVDCSVNDSATISGTMSGIRIKNSAGAHEWPVGLSISDSSCDTGIDIGICTNHAIDVSSTWGVGIDGGAIVVGDYSNAIAFGEVTEHVVGLCVNLSGSTDDTSNFIPIHGKFTTTADCVTDAGAQAVYGRIDIAHNLSSSYAVRGAITMTGDPEVNQVYGMFSTMELAGCNLAETGQVAGLAIELTGSEDITQTGDDDYGKVSGIRVAWEHTNAMTLDTCGIYTSVKSGATLDSGYRINASGTLTDSFHSYNSSGTMTNALKIEGAHTNAFAFPADGTAPVETASVTKHGGTVVKLSCLVGGNQYYMLASTTPGS